MASLPTVRRVITGHDTNGKAVIEADTHLSPCNPITGAPVLESPAPLGFTLIHRTSSFPASNTETPTEYHGKKITLEDKIGTTCRVVDFLPLKMGEDGKLSEGFMHRTQSLDFGVVLKGRITLELDDGLETEMEEGAVVVQRYSLPRIISVTEVE
jgi:hypothetical protein